MIYSLSLATASCLAGLLLLLLGAVAWFAPRPTVPWLKAFPRSRGWGIGLLVLAAGWAWELIRIIDLSEFDSWRPKLLILIPVAAVLTALYVEEMLAVRALGMVVLLAAEPLLEAAFLRPETSRLFLVVFTYLAIVAAMFWIGMPYVLRDHLRWLTEVPRRLRLVALGAGVYGALLLILGLTLHR